jgi:hypothetical protein
VIRAKDFSPLRNVDLSWTTRAESKSKKINMQKKGGTTEEVVPPFLTPTERA